MSATLDHYNRTSARYAEVNHGLASAGEDRERFLALLHDAGVGREGTRRLLDAGSGSGRDTLAFLQAGWEVDAFDGSEAMAALSRQLTGRPTRVMRFESLDLPMQHYDAVWAMASLLHVDRSALPGAVVGLMRSLKPGGLLFASFKEGSADRVDPVDGRAFTDLDDAGVHALVDGAEGLAVVTTLTRDGPDAARGRGRWFSVVLQRTGEPRLKEELVRARRARP